MALVAYRLSNEGVDTVLLDKRDIGTGSTAASTSLLQYEIDTELVDLIAEVGESDAVRAYRLGLEAVGQVEEMVRLIGGDCGFERRKSFYFASKKLHVAKLQREYECRRRYGFEVEYVVAADLEKMFSFATHAAILSTGDAQIDVFRFTQR